MIINSHVHVNTSSNFYFYSQYTIAKLLKEMDDNNIDIALPCLNPKVGYQRCQNDCSFSCFQHEFKPNNDLQNCQECSKPNRHRTYVTSFEGKYRLQCKTCGRILWESYVDPLRQYNMMLLHQTKPYANRLKPLLYISLCEATIQNEMNFYDQHYEGCFCGYKFHPWTDQVSVANISVQTRLPILVHTGLRSYERADDAVLFAQKHPHNKVVVAHAAQLRTDILEEIEKSDNLYLDCCPSSFLFQNKQACLLEDSLIGTPEDIYRTVLGKVRSSKILFGTDSPWGETSAELQIISHLPLSLQEKEDILYRTAQKVYFS